MIPLRHNTAGQTISIGLMTDRVDPGQTKPSLTLTSNNILLHKFGANTVVVKNAGQGATAIQDGIYHTTMNATDTNTLGSLIIYVLHPDALPIRVSCVVFPQVVYDALFAGTGRLTSDVTHFGGVPGAFDAGKPYVVAEGLSFSGTDFGDLGEALQDILDVGEETLDRIGDAPGSDTVFNHLDSIEESIQNLQLDFDVSNSGGGTLIASVGMDHLYAGDFLEIVQGEERKITFIVQAIGRFENSISDSITVKMRDSKGTVIIIPNESITRVCETLDIQVLRATLSSIQSSVLVSGVTKIEIAFDNQKAVLTHAIKIIEGIVTDDLDDEDFGTEEEGT